MKKEDKKGKNAKYNAGFAAVMVTLSSFSICKAVANTVTIPVLARLIRAIEITLDTSLDFGTLAMTDLRGGEATIDPFTNQVVVDGNSSLSVAGGVPRAGRIAIRGSEKPMSISVEDITVRLTNGTTFVTVKDFRFGSTLAGSKVTITPLGIDQTLLLNVGATIQTRSGQLSGSYVGSNRIFANFQ